MGHISPILTLILLPVISAAAPKKLTDCLKPWQKPIMSVATISEPSSPLRCHPETDPCPSSTSSVECQFSFRSFMYVCCEDREDIRAPICPKYHDTLNTFCGGNTRSVCPNGYKCKTSRYDPKIKLCCRPNPRKIHPEPETSFVDQSITPMLIPKAPKKLLTVAYNNKNFTIGELVGSMAVADTMKEPPQIYFDDFDDNKLYTVIIFDITVEDPVTVYWFVPDVAVQNGQLLLNDKKKGSMMYRPPAANEPPYGIHIVVAVVFQQKEHWSDKDLKKVNMKESVDIKSWLKQSSEILVKTPVAGTLFGFTSSNADEGSDEDVVSTDSLL